MIAALLILLFAICIASADVAFDVTYLTSPSDSFYVPADKSTGVDIHARYVYAYSGKEHTEMTIEYCISGDKITVSHGMCNGGVVTIEDTIAEIHYDDSNYHEHVSVVTPIYTHDSTNCWVVQYDTDATDTCYGSDSYGFTLTYETGVYDTQTVSLTAGADTFATSRYVPFQYDTWAIHPEGLESIDIRCKGVSGFSGYVGVYAAHCEGQGEDVEVTEMELKDARYGVAHLRESFSLNTEPGTDQNCVAVTIETEQDYSDDYDVLVSMSCSYTSNVSDGSDTTGTPWWQYALVGMVGIVSLGTIVSLCLCVCYSRQGKGSGNGGSAPPVYNPKLDAVQYETQPLLGNV
ncbi:hypothetical protein KIPB_006146 [Kipferlia bialata]|uniref:Uncharacterized protein n=1 Tax=Kipferlia bialata TaxID=797122 RepID=A0A9K3GJI7_9EUKA|nr:hypothetical protein KIPB_006146 [Kipferlia bialata]|eukprot:g6146.t1